MQNDPSPARVIASHVSGMRVYLWPESQVVSCLEREQSPRQTGRRGEIFTAALVLSTSRLRPVCHGVRSLSYGNVPTRSKIHPGKRKVSVVQRLSQEQRGWDVLCIACHCSVLAMRATNAILDDEVNDDEDDDWLGQYKRVPVPHTFGNANSTAERATPSCTESVKVSQDLCGL